MSDSVPVEYCTWRDVPLEECPLKDAIECEYCDSLRGECTKCINEVYQFTENNIDE